MNPQLKQWACRWRERPHDWLHDGSHSYVLSGVYVRMGGVATLNTAKLSLRLPIALFPTPATGAGARGIGRVYKSECYAIPDETVFDKLTQLKEAPSVVLCPLRLSEPYPVADARKVFELQSAFGAFGRFYKRLRYAVVLVASETSLTARELFKVALGRLRATPLQVGSQLGVAALTLRVALAGCLNLSTAVAVAIGVSRKVLNTEVYAQCARGLRRRFVGKLALQVDVPLALSTSDELPALDRQRGTQEVPLIPADFERDREPPVPYGTLWVNRGQGDGFVLDLDAKDALVVVNGRGFEAACPLALPFANPGYGPDCKVGAKAKLSPDVLVGQLLEMVLVKALRLPGNAQDVVTRRRKSIYRTTQALGLTRLGYQLAAHAQEGHSYT